jgi:hypothetical protein
MLTLVRTALVAFFLGLWTHTKLLFLNVGARLLAALHLVAAAVGHLLAIPVHAAVWVWGCLKSSWDALSHIWK